MRLKRNGRRGAIRDHEKRERHETGVCGGYGLRREMMERKMVFGSGCPHVTGGRLADWVGAGNAEHVWCVSECTVSAISEYRCLSSVSGSV